MNLIGEGQIKKILNLYLTNCKHIYEDFSQQDDIDRNLNLAQSRAVDQIIRAVKENYVDKWFPM